MYTHDIIFWNIYNDDNVHVDDNEEEEDYKKNQYTINAYRKAEKEKQNSEKGRIKKKTEKVTPAGIVPFISCTLKEDKGCGPKSSSCKGGAQC